ncbi:Uu.00g074970.m01.CDS01 [Anthostomella pinea]|uniref:Uu.00g074970.m01.CDS01 n=1 Tax=Anthostomella pinea TaxID=933095 RepID=A0AAI8VVJ8_9PEZI|nr:Uu.00g074970.m01.CDS01 [Anthostomella pinea]
MNRHEKDTGLWFLRSQAWLGWVDKGTRFIWIYGIPGAGKTILASFIVQNIPRSAKTTGMAYYYCYFGHNQDASLPLLRWILSELVAQSPESPKKLDLMQRGKIVVSKENCLDCLSELIGNFDVVYIVVDALDESREPRDGLLSLINVLATDDRFAKIQLLAMSREYSDIGSALTNIAVSVPMDVASVREDIRTHVKSILSTNRRFVKWPSYLRTEVEDALAVGAKGMFRWAICQLDILQRLQTVADIRAALKDLPETLDDTYERIFGSISRYDRTIVQRVLAILCSLPIRANGLNLHILWSMVIEECKYDTDDEQAILGNEDTLKDVCGCLVTSAGTQLVKLAHFTVHEFLVSTRIWKNRNADVRFFATSNEMSNLEFTRIALDGANSVTFVHPGLFDYDNNLYDHLICSSWCMIRIRGDSLREAADLEAVFAFLNPCRPHFLRLCCAATRFSHPTPDLEEPGLDQADAMILWVLVENGLSSLADRFLESRDIAQILDSQIAILHNPYDTSPMSTRGVVSSVAGDCSYKGSLSNHIRSDSSRLSLFRSFLTDRFPAMMSKVEWKYWARSPELPSGQGVGLVGRDLRKPSTATRSS